MLTGAIQSEKKNNKPKKNTKQTTVVAFVGCGRYRYRKERKEQ